MHARVTKLQVEPAELDRANDYYRNTVLAGVRELEGFKGAVTLLDRQTGNVFSFTLWEDEEAMRASEEAGARVRGQASSDLGFTPTVEHYEVGVFEAP
ncbi:MAG: antibiotic biosynthesis monooxygenase [Actinomycetota bacterium]|nr:antibiotic biosynthesis monooxygenase [Actinomycetota bacterium]